MISCHYCLQSSQWAVSVLLMTSDNSWSWLCNILSTQLILYFQFHWLIDYSCVDQVILCNICFFMAMLLEITISLLLFTVTFVISHLSYFPLYKCIFSLLLPLFHIPFPFFVTTITVLHQWIICYVVFWNSHHTLNYVNVKLQ